MRGLEHIPWCYDAMMWVAEATGFRDWRRRLVAVARGRVLDIGCGTGRNLPLYAPDVRLVALDFRLELVVTARRRHPGRGLVVGDAQALPFHDEAFDTVVSGLVFCSVPDPVRGLGEVRRVLDEDGELRMLEHVRSTHPWMAWWQDLIQPLWTWLSGGCHPNRDTVGNVRTAGFQVLEADSFARRNVRLLSARKREISLPRRPPPHR